MISSAFLFQLSDSLPPKPSHSQKAPSQGGKVIQIYQQNSAPRFQVSGFARCVSMIAQVTGRSAGSDTAVA